MRPESRPCPVATHMGFTLAATSEPEPAMTEAEQWSHAYAVEDLFVDVFVPPRAGRLGSTARRLWSRSSSGCTFWCRPRTTTSRTCCSPLAWSGPVVPQNVVTLGRWSWFRGLMGLVSVKGRSRLRRAKPPEVPTVTLLDRLLVRMHLRPWMLQALPLALAGPTLED